jgi:hypothetical protein
VLVARPRRRGHLGSMATATAHFYRLGLESEGGASSVVELKARLLRAQDGSVRSLWEFRLLLKALLPIVFSSIEVGEWIRARKVKLSQTFDGLGLQWDEEFVPPRKSVKMIDITDDIAQDAQLTTSGVVAFLLYCMGHLRSSVDKLRARRVLCGFFARFQSPAMVNLIRPERISEDVRRRCPGFSDADGACLHLKGVIEALGMTDTAGATQLAAFLWDCMPLAKQCATMLVCVSVCLGSISEYITNALLAGPDDFDASYCASSAYQDSMKTKSGNARSTDADYKHHVLDMVKNKRAPTASAVIRANSGPGQKHANELEEKDCAAFAATMKLSLVNPAVLGVAFDCSRLGNPADEVLLQALFEPNKRLGGWCAPQAILYV